MRTYPLKKALSLLLALVLALSALPVPVFAATAAFPRHGIELEQQFAYDLPDLQPLALNYVCVEVLDFILGVYRITLHTSHITADHRATPFFFWNTMDGWFEEVIDYRQDYATFIFQAGWGTGRHGPVSVIVGVGDGLGQVARREVILKGSDLELAFMDMPFYASVPLFFDGLFAPLAAEPIAFPDVPPGHWAAVPIYNFVREGIITGLPDGTFGPELLSTIEQFVTFVLIMSGIDVPPALPGYPHK